MKTALHLRPDRWAVVLAACLLAGAASGQVSQSRYLYTEPDASAQGGIRGHIAEPTGALVGIFALPPDDPRAVYKGVVSGPDKRSFTFSGLPVAKYDLVAVFEDAFFEGLTLKRGESTLTDGDKELINAIIEKTEPFFNRKVIHRLEGETGKMEGAARCVCTFVRTKGALGFIDGKMYSDHRRSFKLVLLEDVGPGWQVVKTREIFVRQIDPGSGHDVVRHAYRPAISGIRVVDSVKDLGEIDLSSAKE